MKKLLLVLLLLGLFVATSHAEEENTVFAALSRVDGVSDVSFGLTKEVATVFDFVEVSALLQGNWTQDGHVGGALLFMKDITTFQIGAIVGVEVDAQLVNPEWSILEQAKAYATYGTYTFGGVVGMDISKYVTVPLTVNAIWYESYGLKDGTLYRDGSQFYANLSLGFSGIL